jgi:hypothetical protein
VDLVDSSGIALLVPERTPSGTFRAVDVAQRPRVIPARESRTTTASSPWGRGLDAEKGT